jgi:hypothetical protein
MSNNFSEIWKNRTNSEPKIQEALYLEIRSIFYTSSIIKRINFNDRDDFFHEFYVNKILHALSGDLVISTSNYDDMSVGQLIYMMKQYSITCYRKEKNKILSDENNTENALEMPLPDSGIDYAKENAIGDMIEKAMDLYQHYSLDDMTKKAINFIYASDPWILQIILKSARGDTFSGNDYPRRAKLGFTLKQSFHTGAISIEDYHQNTIIGRWIISTYSEEVLPLSETFFAQILKSLHNAALYINKEDNSTLSNDKIS